MQRAQNSLLQGQGKKTIFLYSFFKKLLKLNFSEPEKKVTQKLNDIEMFWIKGIRKLIISRCYDT